MVVVASGGVKHEDIVDQATKLFTKLPSDPTTASELVAKEPAIFTGSEIRMLDDDIPLSQFAVAFEGASWTDPESKVGVCKTTLLGRILAAMGIEWTSSDPLGTESEVVFAKALQFDQQGSRT